MGIRNPRPATMPMLATALAALLSACTVGPDFRRPDPPVAAGYLREQLPAATAGSDGPAGDVQHFQPGAPITAQWWHAFGSASLDALIDEALRANPSVAGAQAALRVAQENLAAQRGAYWPQLQANAGVSRQRDATGVLSPALNSGAPLYTLYTPQLGISFVPDLLGGNRRAVEAQQAGVDQARFELEATYQTLVNNVIVTVVQRSGLQAQLEAEQRSIATARDALAILQRSQQLGAVAGGDVAAQQVVLAQMEATLPGLQHQIEVLSHALAALTGHLPADAPDVRIDLAELTLPGQVPLGVPSELVRQRPDVQAAEAALHAATAQVGIADANLLPQLTLSAALGSSATAIADLFKAGTGFWSAGASLSQTLFAGGTLVHRKRAAVAALDTAGATYRATVLTAFQNVADALHALTADAQVLQADVNAEQAAAKSLEIVRRQLALGSVSTLALVSAQQAHEQTLVATAAARASRLADTAALFEALGGAVTPGS